MLVNVFHDTPWEHRRLQLAGVVLIVTMALLLGLSIAIYNKKFTNFTTVTVKADRAGLQLAKFGDVRLHGALVGRIASIKSDGKQAVITLSLSPDAARTIPADVSVRILPTTLFGQNFLELVPPDPGTSAGSAQRRPRHPREPGGDERRAAADPRGPLPAPAVRAPG